MDFTADTLLKNSLCGICGGKHILQECDVVPVKYVIPDKTYPSRAKLSLPDDLQLTLLADSFYRVTTLKSLEKGTVFGPLQAKKMYSFMPSIEFPLKLFPTDDEDLTEYYLDTSNEYECNWMIFIRPASYFEEQNLIIYQQDEELFCVTSRDICEAEELKVWYSPHYALKMKKDILVTQALEDNIQPEPDDLLVMKHRNVAAREIWNCKFCGKIENKITEFAKHLVIHYQAISKKTCEICNDSFANKRLYHKHMKIVHNSNLTMDLILEADSKIVHKRTDTAKETPLGGPLLVNDVTSDSLDNTTLKLILPQPFEMHQETLLDHENLTVDSLLNENVKELDHFNFELNEPESEQMICDICLKTFTKLKYLILHLDQHTGKFTCYQCNKVFARKENFKFHSCRSYYKLKCGLCDKLFFQNKTLNHHLKTFHEKRYACEYCSKIFKSQNQLNQHQPCGKEPAPRRNILHCEICSKKFMWRQNLTVHMRKHLNNTEPLTCPECGRVLKDRRTYMKHLELHNGTKFECDICLKLFNRKDNLIAHKKFIHETEAVTCDICNQKLKNRKLLNEHLKTHNLNRKFKCTHCELDFKNQRVLQKHIIRVHQNRKDDLKKAMYDYSCPKCHKKIKFKWSLRRHVRISHPGYVLDEKSIGEKMLNDDDVLDLKQTIENMNFNTDEINNCSENNDINMELDSLLNNDQIFLNDSNERIVENLIDSVVNDANLHTNYEHKEVCLSMPDLSEEIEIKLGDNAYIMENGTIVEPKKDASEVVVYILNNKDS